MQHQHAAHGLRASLAEADVVLAAAALVGVAFEPKLRVRVLREELAVRLQQRVELGQDVGRVVIEVDDELLHQRASLTLRFERRYRDAAAVVLALVVEAPSSTAPFALASSGNVFDTIARRDAERGRCQQNQ